MNSDEWVELQHLQRIKPSLNEKQKKRLDELSAKTRKERIHPFNFDGFCLCDCCLGLGDYDKGFDAEDDDFEDEDDE